MNEKELKLTDLDYAVGSHRLQMMKAALPYMEIPQQRTMSMFIKWNELLRTMEFFQDNEDGMLSVCALDEGHSSPSDMLQASPFLCQREGAGNHRHHGKVHGKSGVQGAYKPGTAHLPAAAGTAVQV